jgi:hypothetical protein
MIWHTLQLTFLFIAAGLFGTSVAARAHALPSFRPIWTLAGGILLLAILAVLAVVAGCTPY